jgi:hypothetical protein
MLVLRAVAAQTIIRRSSPTTAQAPKIMRLGVSKGRVYRHRFPSSHFWELLVDDIDREITRKALHPVRSQIHQPYALTMPDYSKTKPITTCDAAKIGTAPANRDLT